MALKGMASTKTKKEESRMVPKKREINEVPTHCPVCGQTLVDAPSGLWCPNPNCVVTDDCNLYMKNSDE
jgi:hypothetical protein